MLEGSGPLYALNGVAPVIADDAFIAPNAAIIGDVEIGPGSSVWFGCVLRGDDHFIRIGARTNVQDGTIIHVTEGISPTLIGDDVTIGHAAILHGCTLANRAFVGMGAVILDGGVIEEGGVLAGGGLLLERRVIGRNELWAGAPAKLRRVLTPEERATFDFNARHYAGLARRYRLGAGS